MEKNISNQISLKPAQKGILSFALCLVAFMFVLDYTIANVAIPYIAGGLGVSNSEGTYVITFFAVGNAIFLPMTSWLVKIYGDAKVIISSTLLFTFFSFTCAASPSLLLLVISRFLQGAAAGPLIPLSQAILTKLYRDRIDRITTLFSMIVMVAPVVGPIVGGYICINYIWRWIFYINLPIGLVSIFLMYTYMKGYKFEKMKIPFDWITFILLLFGMTCLQLFLDKGQQWDWWHSDRVRILSVIAMLSISYIIIWSFTYNKPLFNFYLFRNRRFAVSCIMIFFAYSLYFAAVVIFPVWLEEVLGYTAYKAGVAVAPVGIGAFVGAVIVGRLLSKVQPFIFMVIGFFIQACACFYAANFVSVVSLYHVALSRLIFGFGLSLWIVPIMTICSSSLSDEDLPSGLGIFHFLRSISGGIGTSIYITLYLRRGIHQNTNLAYTFNGYKEVCRSYYHDIEKIIPSPESAQYFLGREVDIQSKTFAFCEVNNLMGYICLLLMILSLFTFQKKSDISI